MEKYAITPGDFLKNAGIVGLKYILDCAKAQESVDFGISEDGQEMWLNYEFIQNADWTSLYFQACVQNFGRFTVYQGVMEKIKCCIGKIQNEKWNPGKNEKDDLKFINDKLLSNSYQAGFENIKDQIEHPEVYITLKKEKLYQIPTYRMKREEVKTVIFRYIFGYYNTQRINSFNAGGLPPVALRTSKQISHHAA